VPWKLYRFKYEDYPEYSARITGHYAGDLLIIEEEGELSDDAVRIMKRTLGIDENVRAFDLMVEDILRLSMKELPENDRKVILQASEKLDGESKLHVEYRHVYSFD